MLSFLAKLASSCIQPVLCFARSGKSEGESNDSLFWDRDLSRHCAREFSIAIVQANEVIEDHCQVETGSAGTFVGVYDGHGGPDASRFVSDHLFPNFIRIARESGAITEDVIRKAFSATESGYLTFVRRTVSIKPLISVTGSCCLAGAIWDRTLYIANLGDSRAVLGYVGRSGDIIAEQLTTDHNASMEEVRQELRSLHPDDPQIVVLKNGVWRIKGIIQVSRSIGDAYLKKPEFMLDPAYTRFQLPGPLRRPVLSAEPSISTRDLQPQDKFLIFASDGLWEHLTNQEAVEIVQTCPRKGIARRLVRTALQIAARKREMRYPDLKKLDKGIRRFFHDDISVVVLFIDHELLGKDGCLPSISVKGFINSSRHQIFRNWKELVGMRIVYRSG